MSAQGESVTGPDEFDRQLRMLRYELVRQGDFCIFDYEIPLGSRIGEVVKIGLQVSADFPLTPPPGPHVCPRIGHPGGNVNASSLGTDFEYWSRPFHGWQDNPTAKAYLAHLRKLFAQL